ARRAQKRWYAARIRNRAGASASHRLTSPNATPQAASPPATKGRAMRAIAVIPERRELRLIEQEEPSLYGPYDVKVKILDVGVCGTDREICRFDYGTPPANGAHLVIGHETVGEVVAV